MASVTLISLAILALAGLALCIWGFRGRRVGSEPHCRKCRYNLTGLTSERCPECGRVATGRNVVIGTRRRQWRALVPGLAALLISISAIGSFVYVRSQSIEWRKYLPTAALRQLAKGDDRRAIELLLWRCEAGDADIEQLLDLAPIALEQQSRAKEPGFGSVWVRFLGRLELADGLNRKQREQFYDQLMSFRLEFRPKVRHGETITFALSRPIAYAPGLSASYSVKSVTITIGDWVGHRRLLGRDSLDGSGSRWNLSVAAILLEPGVYDVEFQATKIVTGPFQFERRIEQRYRLEVLPADAPDTVRVIDDPSLADDFKRVISFRTSRGSWDGTDPEQIHVVVDIKHPGVPVQGAFRVIALIGDREVGLGSICPAKMGGERGWWGGWGFPIPPEAVANGSFIPILRSSIDVARETTDVFEIWDGELRFDPISVSEAGSEQQPDGP